MNNKILILPEVYEEVNTGGPLSVVFNLSQNDIKGRFNFIYKKGKIERHVSNKTNSLKKNLKKIGLLKLLDYLFYLYKVNRNIISRLETQENCISHEIFYSFLLIFFKKTKNLLPVIHSQGNIYNENINLGGVGRSFLLKAFLDQIESYVIKGSIYVGFPSNGAFEGFLSTASEKTKKLLLEYKNQGKIKIFYNGVKLDPKSTLTNGFNKNPNELLFTTVSTLNYEKGVDRIPSFIAKMRDAGINVRWILIGNGAYGEKINEDIKKFELNNIVSIYNTPFKKEEIIGLFKKSDFYVMFHRLSVFDYATLEAMNEGVIPILSNIGGNKEVIIDKNGFLISEEDLVNEKFDEIINSIKSLSLSKYNERNKDVISKYFSENEFIEKYYGVIDELLLLK